MASTGCSVFSHDGQYLAYCGNDGKLKIWEVATNRLKQEYIPNLHLSSPCSVLCWISVNPQATCITPSPWKKRRRKLISEEFEKKGIVAMGSMNGTITLYDTTSASVSSQLENGHTATVTALTWSASSGLFTAADDHQIIQWNIKEKGIKCKWKSGKGKTTALVVLSDGQSLLSGERSIKWWNISTKQLIRTFTGHATQVTSLHSVEINNDTTYLISGAYGDSHLGVWLLDEDKNDKSSVATLTMQDDATSISVHVAEESHVTVLATSRSGQAHLFRYQPNGRSKPLKPSLNVAVASDSNQKESIQQIPILIATLTENEKMLLAYGSYLNPRFEKVVPDFSDKIQCLVRSEFKKIREKKDELVSKIKAPVIDGEVEYLAPGTVGTTVKRNRTNSTGSQLLLKDRLENLSLNAETHSPGKTPTKGVNMAQLLLQGLHSKDKNILTTVLFTKNENLIRNTIAKLPVQVLAPLLKELIAMLQGRTYPCKIAVVWLKALLSVHAAHLLSRPDIGEMLSPVLSLIDAKLMLLTDVSRLKGRISLVTGQIAQSNEDHENADESLLVYQDQDSSDEGGAVSDALSSDSGESWEEMSDQDVQDDHSEEDIRNTKSADENDSICS